MNEIEQQSDVKKMRQKRLKCMFALLAAFAALLTFIMHSRVGYTSMRIFQEIISDIHSDDMGHVHEGHNHDQEIPFILRDSHLDPEQKPAHHLESNQLAPNLTQNSTYRKPKFYFGRPIKDGFDAQLGDGPAFNPILPDTEKTIAIGCAITTREQTELTGETLEFKLPFFKGLLSSFCRTCTVGYDYNFYVAHDHIDPFFIGNNSHVQFTKAFYNQVKLGCPRRVNVTLHLVECNHAGNPAWAQNDAMMAAYMDNMAYYYRVNDDTVMETTGWTEKLVEHLLRYTPLNVGVVGPWFKEGNVAILTHDFVHRTHIDIFGFYYPRVFTDWFADDWITGIYYPERCQKVPGVRVKHTMEAGNRYVVHFEKANRVAMEVQIGRLILKRWMERKNRKEHYDESWDQESKMVISMSLYGNDMDILYGALRYSQLVPILFPNWRVRVYTTALAGKSTSVTPLDIIVRKLDNMGVEVVRLATDVTDTLPPDLWRFLVADDNTVDRFIIRTPNTRPSEREAAALSDWLKTQKPFHCIRDHPSHAAQSLIPTLVGGIPHKLRFVVQQSWRTLMRGYTSDRGFMQEVIWPKVKDVCYCHDSVSCTVWPGSQAFPVLRGEDEFVGQRYDANDQVIDADDTLLWNASFIRPECVFLKNTGFAEEAVKSVIRRRPVFWSQDYHVTPIMDIKSLLNPIGVKTVDNSLSYYCGNVGTCASNLKVINRDNGMRLSPELIDQFYRAYAGSQEMKRVTSFVCTLPVAMCEAFVKFNKSMIIISTIRYEQARPEPHKWKALNELLVNVSKDAKSLVAANNLYDAKYIEYFTGLKPVVIPNYCAYLKDSYQPSRKQFLVTPIHSTELYDKFFMEFDEEIMRRRVDLTIFPLRQLYPQYLFGDLAAHPAIIYFPYQVSMSSLTEQYRMNIPLFFPTIDLLSKWHIQYQIVRQRTWAGYMRKVAGSSLIPGVLENVPDPNNDMDEDAVKYWLQFADFYQWPHIIYFDNVEDLVDKMMKIDLDEISRRMKEHNEKQRLYIKDLWSHVLLKVTEGKDIPGSYRIR